MDLKRKKPDYRTELQAVVKTLKDLLTTDRQLLYQDSGWAGYVAVTLDECLATLTDVQEDLHVWDSTELAEECLRDFSRLGLSASIYLLRRHYYELKDGQKGETKFCFLHIVKLQAQA